MDYKPLIFLAVGAAIVAPLMYLIGQGQFLMAGFLVAAVFFLILFRRIDLWWMVAVMTLGSSLVFVSVRASAHLMSVLGFCALGVAAYIMTQGRAAARLSTPQKAALVLLLITVLTASLRGWGLRVLGSATWGGMDYVITFSSLLFFILSSRITLSEKRLWFTVKGLCLLALIPAITIVLARTIPGAQVLTLFVHVHGAEAAEGGTAASGRMGGMQFPAVWSAVLALLLFGRRFSLTPAVIVLGLMSFVMMGLSGHRTVLVLIGLTVLFYLLVQRRSVRMGQYLSLLFLILAVVATVFAYVEQLPVTFQRAMAWIPGLNVAHEAALSAAGTTNWRIEMWQLMLPMIPEYLLLGRGLAFDLMSAYSAYTLASDYERYMFFIATHNYHNGPLFLLIDLGVAGFLAASVMMFSGIVYFKKQFKYMPPNTTWHNMYTVLFCFYSAYVVFFYLVIGGPLGLSRVLIVASVLEVIARSARKQQAVAPEPDATALEPVRYSPSGNRFRPHAAYPASGPRGYAPTMRNR